MQISSFYKYSAIILLALNVMLIVFFFLNRPTQHLSKKFDAQKILGLTELQNEDFLNKAQLHIDLMKGYDEIQKSLLQDYFSSLYDGSGTTNQEAILDQVQKIELEKIESVYSHLEEVRALLTKDQLSKFETFSKDAIDKILGGHRNMPPPPNGQRPGPPPNGKRPPKH